MWIIRYVNGIQIMHLVGNSDSQAICWWWPPLPSRSATRSSWSTPSRCLLQTAQSASLESCPFQSFRCCRKKAFAQKLSVRMMVPCVFHGTSLCLQVTFGTFFLPFTTSFPSFRISFGSLRICLLRRWDSLCHFGWVYGPAPKDACSCCWKPLPWTLQAVC